MTDDVEHPNGTGSAATDPAAEPGDREERTRRAVEAATTSSPMPFEDLRAPAPIPAEPPTAARWLAFASVLVSGLLGGMIGYGTGDLMTSSSLLVAVGGLVGALIGAVGVGVVASLTLRAMNEWYAVQHPEAGESGPVPDGLADGPSADAAEAGR